MKFFLSATLFFWAFIICAQPVRVTVSPEIKHQYIEGFGTCIVDFTEPPATFTDPEFYDKVVNDLGMSALRMSFPQEIEEANDDNDPNHFRWPGFHMRYLERRMKIALEFKKRGVDRFVFSTWSPSEFIKSNRSTVQGGYVRMDMYDEYAENIAACILAAKQNWGIDVGAFSIQNELMFIEPYKSCIYNPYTAREAVRALMQKFEKEGISTRIQLPEDMMYWARMYNYILPTMQDPETRNFHGDFCTHRQQEWDEVTRWNEVTRPFHRQTWMTETSGHEATWAGAFKLACDMYDYLVGGNMSAWFYWQITDNASSSEYALMIGKEPTPKYYASKHFYRWVRPGAVRVEAHSTHPDLLVSTFRHDPDGSLTMVLINRSDKEMRVEVDPGDAYKHVPMQVFRSGEHESCIPKGVLVENGLTIPSRHIVTLYGQSDGLKSGSVSPWPEACARRTIECEKIGSFVDFEPHSDGALGNVVRYNKLEQVQAFFNGKDIDTESGNGWTALYWAIVAGKADVIKWLLAQGADIHHKAPDGWMPIHAAAATFVNEKDESGTLYTKYDLFRLLLDAGADVTAVTPEGFTALHIAAMNENIAWMQKADAGVNRIRALAEAGLDVNGPDNKGRTPLHWAAWQGATDMGIHISNQVVKELLRLGADYRKTDYRGRMPLHYAAEMGYPEIVFALVEAGADIHAKDFEGHSPLDLAKSRKLETIEIVLTEGRIPGIEGEYRMVEDPKGSGLYGLELIRATRAGNMAEVKDLLGKGADVWFRDSDGFRAFDRARDNNNTELIRLLRDAEMGAF